MNFDNNENQQYSGSIFSNPELNQPEPREVQISQNPQKPDILTGLIKHITSKIIDPNTGQSIRELKKLEKQAKQMEEENGDMIQILKDFGAKLVYNGNEIIVNVPRLGLSGKLLIDDKGEMTVDENAKEIFTKMARYVNGRNSFDFTMNMYAEIGFYPVGDLSQTTVVYKGKELTVQKGVLMNKQGETRDFYMYNGQEILLDNEEDEEEKLKTENTEESEKK